MEETGVVNVADPLGGSWYGVTDRPEGGGDRADDEWGTYTEPARI